MRDSFATFHPIVNITYFIAVLLFSMFFMHPIFLGIAFISAYTYSFVQKGRDALQFNIIYMLPMLVFMAILNPIFNHEGVTILFYLKSGNPITLESIIYATQTVTFNEGESVFDVLLREMQKNKIHMEFVMTPIYNSNYVEGINNLYEFDCGELSGWMYRVNGWFPNYGCSRYVLEDGDVIEWIYTCDLGRDIGGDWAITGGGS